MYLEENRNSRATFELTKGETNPLIKKFIGVNLPVKGGSIVIETTYGETLWITKYNSNGDVVFRDKEFNQIKVLPIVEKAEQINSNQELIQKKNWKRVFDSRIKPESSK